MEKLMISLILIFEYKFWVQLSTLYQICILRFAGEVRPRPKLPEEQPEIH